MSDRARGPVVRLARVGACLAALCASPSVVAGEVEDAQRRAVVELVLLAGMPHALDQRLDAFAKDIAGKLPQDTPADALAEVVRRIRVAVRADAILADVAADAAARLTPDEVASAVAQLHDGQGAPDVVGLLGARLARATDRELARASERVLGEVNVEIEKSTDETEANLAKWKRDIDALRARADTLAPAPTAPAAAAK